MAKYYIYKNDKVINIIEAEQTFIDELIKNKSIDKAIKEGDPLEPKSLTYDINSQTFKELNSSPVNPVPEVPITTPLEIVMNYLNEHQQTMQAINVYLMSTKSNIDSVTTLVHNLKAQMNDIQSGFIAMNGFLQILPDIKKELDEIKGKLNQ